MIQESAAIEDDPLDALGEKPLGDRFAEHLRARLVGNRESHTDAMRVAHRLGVPIAMGTDAGTPGNHHGSNADECVAMVEEIGMTPQESILAATLNPARLLRQEENLGSLAAGKFADIVGCAEDPLDDIRALTRIGFVMKGGATYKDNLGRS